MRLALAIGGVLVVVVGIVFAFNLGQGTGPEDAGQSPAPDASSAPAKPIKVASVSDFDPVGDNSENPDTAPLAVDGDPASAWRTVTYYDPLEQQKAGVGLLLDLGRPVEVSEVSVSFVGSPTSFDVLAADQATAEPTSTEGLTRVGGQKDAGAKADVTLDKPVTTRYLVVWLTSLPSASGGYVGQVAEIVVR
jgi:hypothetical protein